MAWWRRCRTLLLFFIIITFEFFCLELLHFAKTLQLISELHDVLMVRPQPPPPTHTQVVKVESGVLALTPPQTDELHFLRSRVQELEKEKAELSAENQRLKTMLVHGEFPGSTETSQVLTGSQRMNSLSPLI